MARTRPGDGQLEGWLSALPLHDGIRQVSEARHFGNQESGEAAYAEQFVVDDAYEEAVGAGLAALLDCIGADRSAPALEVGAGTGIFSRALVARGGYPACFITDMSPRFLELTRKSMGAAVDHQRVEFVMLSSEDIGRWPKETLSLVALRFVLHHVLDWQAFIHQAALLLRPGGVLVVEEPCADGYLLQAALANMARRSPAVAAELTPAARHDLDFFVDTTLWYLRTGVDKRESEDKHVFALAQLLGTFRDAGLEPTFLQNRGFDSALSGRPLPAEYFVQEFRHNLAVNFGFGSETMDLFERHLAPACSDLSLVDGEVNGPVVRGVVAARRPAAGGRRPWALVSNAKVKTRALKLGRDASRLLPVAVKDRVPARVRQRFTDAES